MGQTTVTQFAGELKMPASVLLEQLQKAGVDKARETDLLSEQDKTRLLDFLRRAHGDTAAKSKITLTRRTLHGPRKSQGLCAAQAQRRRQGQTTVATPGIPARHGLQAPFDQQTGSLPTHRTDTLHARTYRLLSIRIDWLALSRQSQLRA